MSSRALAALSIFLLAACSSLVVNQNAQQAEPFPPPKNEPPIITPGKTDSDPPSDAIVLFDGKDLSK